MNDNLMSGFKSRTGTSDTHAGDNTINPMGTAQSGSENPSRGGASQMNPMSSKTASSSGQHGGMGDTAEQQMRGTAERIVSFYNLMGWNAAWE
jgi:hypothetical protein